MTFITTARRFYMRHLPEMLLCNTEEARQWVLSQFLTSMPHGEPQELVTDFFADAGSEMHHREVLTRMFGAGERRLYHAEHNLMDVPMGEMPTLQAMVERLSSINTALMKESDATLDADAWYRDSCDGYNLWLTSLKQDRLHFIIANSMITEYGLLAQDMIHQAMAKLIPREMVFEEADDGIRAHFHVEGDLHQKIWREMNRRGMRRSIHWVTQMKKALAQQPSLEWQVATEESLDEHGYPLTTYCFLAADSARHVRFEHWDSDIARFTPVSRQAHLAAVEARYAAAIKDDVQALYDQLVAEVTQSDVTPLYTHETGNGLYLRPNFFDKS